MSETEDRLCWNCGEPESGHALQGDWCPQYDGEELSFSKETKFAPDPPERPEPEPCGFCGGAGLVTITSDMAMDAGDVSMAGSKVSCQFCLGSGVKQ